MSNLFTVDIDSASTKLVPTTLQALENDLRDSLTKVYVYIGKENDRGWKVALSVTGFLGNLKPYLTDDSALLSTWVPSGTPAGVVFGFDDIPDRLLNAVEAADSEVVQAANEEAE